MVGRTIAVVVMPYVFTLICCRAMLREPSLILCDEITSSVDAFAERDIVDSLRQVLSVLSFSYSACGYVPMYAGRKKELKFYL